MLYLAAHAENKEKELLLNVLTAVMDAAPVQWRENILSILPTARPSRR